MEHKNIKKRRKSLLKWFLLAIILIATAILVTVNNHHFQRYLAQKVSEEVTAALHIPFSVQKIKFGYALGIQLEEVVALDHQQDTLLSAHQITVRLSELNMKKGVMRLNDVALDKVTFKMLKHAGDETYNLSYLIRSFSDTTSTSSGNPMEIQIGSVSITDARFVMENRSKPRASEGMDFNYLNMSRINAVMSEFVVRNDSIMAHVKYLSAKEKSGLEVNRLSGAMVINSFGWTAELLEIQTPYSDISLDFHFDYDGYDALSDFIENVKINAYCNDAVLNVSDLAYFAPSLKGMDYQMGIQGVFQGKVSDLYGQNLQLKLGAKSFYKGFVHLKNLPDIKSLQAEAIIDAFHIDSADIHKITLPGDKKLQLPKALKKMAFADVIGSFEGSMKKFNANAVVYSNLGTVSTDFSLRDSVDMPLLYDGKLFADSLNIGALLDMEDDFGSLDLETEIHGNGMDFKTLSADISSVINNLEYHGNVFDSIMVNGILHGEQFGGNINITDELINFDFAGLADLNPDNSSFNFTANLKDVYLAKLKLIEVDDPETRISSTIVADFKGLDVDSIAGSLIVSDLEYGQDNFLYHLDSLEIVSTSDSNRIISFRSDFLDGDVSGDFLMNKLGKSFKALLHGYMPALFPSCDTLQRYQQFTYDLTLKDTEGLSYIFMPSLRVSEATKIFGAYNSQHNDLQVNIVSDSISLNDIHFNEIEMKTGRMDSGMEVDLNIKDIILSGANTEEGVQLGFEQVNLNSVIDNDSVSYSINWDDLDSADRNIAEILGGMKFFNLQHFTNKIVYSQIRINDSLWTVNPLNYLEIDTSSIAISQLGLAHKNQRILLDGVVADDPEKEFRVSLEDFNISDFDMILNASGMDVDGIVNGDLVFSNLSNTPRFTGEIDIAKLFFNEEKLGDMSLLSEWNQQQKSFDIHSHLVYTGRSGSREMLNLEGAYWPEAVTQNDSVYLESRIKNLSIKTLEPFFADFLSEMSGWASGKLVLAGSFDQPELSGEVSLVRGGIRVGFLNTKYYLADDIVLRPDAIAFDSIYLYDTLGNAAILNGEVQHKHFKDFNLDIHIHPQKFAGLYTDRSHNELFYGTAFASGQVDITGPVSDIKMRVVARPEKNTNIVIPISTEESVKENDFITFISAKDEKEKSVTFTQMMNTSGFNMDFQLEINPNAQANIILPFQMGNIKGAGLGNMRMEMNSVGDFSMYGDYNIEEGIFVLKLQNILRNTFEIQRGASISWSGDPYDADVNVTAVYKARPKLNLPAAASIDPEMSSERVDVNCVIHLKNKLFNPTIDFGIELPNADNTVKEVVYSSIDTTNSAEMNKQMLSLLVLNSFSVSGMENSLSTEIGSQTFEVLSNQISSWLSNISKDVDIGINYRPGDSYTSEELEVALSTQLFDDRVSIDGNFGMSGMQQEEQTNTNTIVGDVNVEVKITQDGRFRVRAFNRTNNTDLLSVDSPYTQGVGVFYRKEFDTLYELFKKKQRDDINVRRPKKKEKKK